MKNIARRITISLLRILALLGVITLALWWWLTQPQWGQRDPSAFSVGPAVLQQHVKTLSVDFHPRNYQNPANLRRSADYIAEHFRRHGARVYWQKVSTWAGDYYNVIGIYGQGLGSRYVVGAHYDSSDLTPGADDNASGVAGLLELATLLGRHGSTREVHLVAWVLEEPPFFDSPDMGSHRHAALLRGHKVPIDAAISLEMIGYFSDEPGSQSYPVPGLMHLLYSTRGDFIALVGRHAERDLLARLKYAMRGRTPLPVYSLSAPPEMTEIGLSDHASYWKQGYPAVMITDTAFERNHEYHRNDTWQRLDYRRMSQVVIGVYEALRQR